MGGWKARGSCQCCCQLSGGNPPTWAHCAPGGRAEVVQDDPPKVMGGGGVRRVQLVRCSTTRSDPALPTKATTWPLYDRSFCFFFFIFYFFYVFWCFLVQLLNVQCVM